MIFRRKKKIPKTKHDFRKKSEPDTISREPSTYSLKDLLLIYKKENYGSLGWTKEDIEKEIKAKLEMNITKWLRKEKGLLVVGKVYRTLVNGNYPRSFLDAVEGHYFGAWRLYLDDVLLKKDRKEAMRIVVKWLLEKRKLEFLGREGTLYHTIYSDIDVMPGPIVEEYGDRLKELIGIERFEDISLKILHTKKEQFGIRVLVKAPTTRL